MCAVCVTRIDNQLLAITHIASIQRNCVHKADKNRTHSTEKQATKKKQLPQTTTRMLDAMCFGISRSKEQREMLQINDKKAIKRRVYAYLCIHTA